MNDDPDIEEGSISSAAWDILTEHGITDEEGFIEKPLSKLAASKEDDLAPEHRYVPDLSNVEVPEFFIGESKEEKPAPKHKTQYSKLLTEEEIQVLERAKKIISKVLEMTTCGTIGVNMAGPGKKAPKKITLKPKKKVKKAKSDLLTRLKQYE
jgi:hypothetical protein